MKHYVYETTNLINGMKYIGKRSCDCNIDEDEYLGSGTAIRSAIKEFGNENFRKEILCVCDSEAEAYKKEKYYIDLYNVSTNDVYYNIKNGGEGVKRNKREITVVCNYPTPENMEMFQKIMCDGIAKALIKSKSPEYIEALKRALEKDIELNKN